MKRIIVIISGFTLVVIVVFLMVFIFHNPFLKVELKGNKEDTIEVNSNYEDKKVKALMLNKDISDKVVVKGNLDNKKIGSYKITYIIKYLKTEKTVSRVVKVIDTKKPVITLNGSDTVILTEGDKYEEENVVVSDNYDTNLEEKVEIISTLDTNKVGEYEIVYKVKDSSNNEASIKRKVIVKEKEKVVIEESQELTTTYSTSNAIEPTYINGILLVNKKYGLPANYGSGIDPTALANLHQLQSDAKAIGLNIPTLSAYRSYETQKVLYNNYYQRDGAFADTYSARPGHSEHQTGLAFDVGQIDNNYGETTEGKWLAANCMKYGFIIRYPSGKESITGYQYEPWHIRYVGVNVATDIMSRGITLEEYLGV